MSPAFVSRWGTPGTAPGQLALPMGLALDAAGDLYVAEPYYSRIQVFTLGGGHRFRWGMPGTGPGQFNWPSGVAISPSGLMYVADGSTHRIPVFGDTAVPATSTSWGALKAFDRD